MADLKGMDTTSRYFVADLVAEVGSLPSVAAQIVARTADPQCDIGDLCRLIQSDSVMTMRFMALANSAALSGNHEARDLRAALVRLGMRRIRNLSLFMGMHDMDPAASQEAALDRREYWKYSLATASAAQGLADHKGRRFAEDAWLTGILHGIGIVALQQNAAPGFQQALARAREFRMPLVQAELEVLDFHHGELGARILRQWGLPPLFADVTDYHLENFAEDEVGDECRQLIDNLRQAITFVRAFAVGTSGEMAAALPIADLGTTLNLSEPAIADLAARVDQEVAELSRLVELDLDAGHFQKTLEHSQKQAARLGLEGFEDTLAREKLEEELAVARRIQQHLLPSTRPDVPGMDIAAINQPSLQVSGDTYDFVKIKGGQIGLSIADVCGKGIPAALLASNLQASLRALAGVLEDPGQLLAAVNEALVESTDPENFATLFLAVLAADGSGFRYVSAGHTPALLLRRDGTAEWLKPAGPALGMFPGSNYPEREVALQPGDLVVAYTDGITEAVDGRNREFANAGLESACRDHAGKTCTAIIEGVIARVLAHVKGADGVSRQEPPSPAGGRFLSPVPAGDDLTMLAFRRLTP
jgi:serine phosphatase RsbU (regulator of sigma subunit)/HD-like signal output (HDOD) protein